MAQRSGRSGTQSLEGFNLKARFTGRRLAVTRPRSLSRAAATGPVTPVICRSHLRRPADAAGTPRGCRKLSLALARASGSPGGYPVLKFQLSSSHSESRTEISPGDSDRPGAAGTVEVPR
eukprot:306836-Hanusia_phi.AAC.1